MKKSSLFIMLILIISSTFNISAATIKDSLNNDYDINLGNVFIFCDEYGECVIEIDLDNAGYQVIKLAENTIVNISIHYYLNINHDGLYFANVNLTIFDITIPWIFEFNPSNLYEIIEGDVYTLYEYKKGDISEIFYKVRAVLIKEPLPEKWIDTKSGILKLRPKSMSNYNTNPFTNLIREDFYNINIKSNNFNINHSEQYNNLINQIIENRQNILKSWLINKNIFYRGM